MMSDQVEVPFGDNPGETATLLLAAADDLDLDPSVVQTVSGAFLVPQDVLDKAGVEVPQDETELAPEEEPAKKTAAKKK